MTARYFKYEEEYNKTPFIKKIILLTTSKVKNAKFNLRIYDVSKDGSQGNLIYNENIIGIAKKGNRKTKVDIHNLNIEFPKEGFFLAFEWLHIEENKKYKTIVYKNRNTKEKIKSFTYQPYLATVPKDTGYDPFEYVNGTWKIIENKGVGIANINNYNYLIAAQLILSN